MAKQFKRFNVKKHVGFFTNDQGEEKKKYEKVGEMVLFSDSQIPADLSVKLEMIEHMNPVSGNDLSVFSAEPRG